MCKKLLQTSDQVRDCMVYKPKVLGRSEATHEFEFVLFQPISTVEVSIGKTAPLLPNLSVSLQRIGQANQKANIVLTAAKSIAAPFKQVRF